MYNHFRIKQLTFTPNQETNMPEQLLNKSFRRELWAMPDPPTEEPTEEEEDDTTSPDTGG